MDGHGQPRTVGGVSIISGCFFFGYYNSYSVIELLDLNKLTTKGK